MKDIKDQYQNYLRSPTVEMLADNAWYLPTAAPSQRPGFFRFSKLPPEIRRMIGPPTPVSSSGLPRPELLKDNNNLINYEIDILRFTCCPTQFLGAWQFPTTLLQRLKRMEVAITCNRMVSYGLCRVGRKCLHSFDSFLHLVVSAYFPNLRELRVEVDFLQIHPRTCRLAHLREFGWNVDHIMGVPYFLRLKEANGGGGVLISSSASEDQRRHHVAMINIVFMDKKDATLYASASGGDASGDDNKKEINPLDHRDFLDGLAACLWHVFSIQTFLWRDEVVREILQQGNCRCW
ncbi:uncharacterized protein PG998_005143 [Apiospora kogelbergensis]|uniref:uncharacterized protein n=1 Tax=Apiospora kogelbergensis TaxID=1337665 RepID=UPI003131B5A4